MKGRQGLFFVKTICIEAASSQRRLLRALFGGREVPGDRLQLFGSDLRCQDWYKDSVSIL